MSSQSKRFYQALRQTATFPDYEWVDANTIVADAAPELLQGPPGPAGPSGGGSYALLQKLKSYSVTKVGSTYFIYKKDGNVAQSGTDFSAAMNAELNSLVNGDVALFLFDSEQFTETTPIIIPASSNTLGERFVTFLGNFTDSTAVGTRLIPDAVFPSGRYAIECNTNLATSTETVNFRIDGFLFSGRLFARHTNGNNIFGGSTVIDFGGVKLSHSANSKWPCQISNIFGVYLWRGVHLLGQVWFSNFRDWHFVAPNAEFDGDNVIILENGGHANFGSNPTPKGNNFHNIKASLTGIYKSFIQMKAGNYNHFDDIFPDGHIYREAVFNLDNTDIDLDPGYIMGGNVFDHLQTLDINIAPTPDNRKGGTLYINGPNVLGNTFKDTRLPKYPDTIKIAGGAQRNVIELSGYYGSATTIHDETAAPSNTVIITADFKAVTIPGTTPVVSTHGNVRIIDKRGDAYRDGATSVADGETITHKLAATPAVVIAMGRVAGEIVSVTARTATTFTVSIKKHDGTSGTTQIVDWMARI